MRRRGACQRIVLEGVRLTVPAPQGRGHGAALRADRDGQLFQRLDEERLTYTATALTTYTDALAQGSTAIDQVCAPAAHVACCHRLLTRFGAASQRARESTSSGALGPQSCARMRASVQDCTAEADINAFVNARMTGTEIPGKQARGARRVQVHRRCADACVANAPEASERSQTRPTTKRNAP